MTSNMAECFNNVLKGVRALPVTAMCLRARMGGPLAGWIHLTLRTLPPKVLEVRLGRIPPGVPEVGSEGYLHCPWRYRHVSINFVLFRLPLTRRATSIDRGGIQCNPTFTVSGGSKKS
jgi:hypothetical protein